MFSYKNACSLSIKKQAHRRKFFCQRKTYLIIPCFVYVYVYVFIYGRTTSYIKSRLAALSPAPRLPLRFAGLKAPAAAGRLASGKLPRPAGTRFPWCRLDLFCGAVTRERIFFFMKGRFFFGACCRPGLAVLGSWDAVGVISLCSASGPIPPGNG